MQEYFILLREYGFFDYFLPFILILTIIYLTLQERKIVSKEERVNITIAVCISLIGIISINLSSFISSFLGKVFFALIVLIFYALLVGIMGVEPESKFFQYGSMLVFLAVLFIQFIDYVGNFTYAILTSYYFWVILTVLGLVLFLTKKPALRTSE
ncbi:hypothetical protein J4405_05660 [Candidatus Woesearchaeota archaeon]|nr:hypothetical protein [Candidatus Woesearchaeota archaeon]